MNVNLAVSLSAVHMDNKDLISLVVAMLEYAIATDPHEVSQDNHRLLQFYKTHMKNDAARVRQGAENLKAREFRQLHIILPSELTSPGFGHYFQGVLLISYSLPCEAMVYLKSAIKQNSQDPVFFATLALAQFGCPGRQRAAVNNINKALKLRPGFRFAQTVAERYKLEKKKKEKKEDNTDEERKSSNVNQEDNSNGQNDKRGKESGNDAGVVEVKERAADDEPNEPW